MNIIVIHGDHIENSTQRLRVFIDEAKKRKWSIKRVGKIGKDTIQQQLRSESLFAGKALYVVGSFKDLSDKDIEWLKNNHKKYDFTLVIYNKGNINKTTINRLPKSIKAEEYTLPKLIWSLLDSFYPGNTRNCLKLFQDVAKNEPYEFVFALLARHLRDLYWSTLDENDFPDWRRNKLRNQAKKFKEGQIKILIKRLAEIDVKTKTSKATIKDELDLLIVSELELNSS